jgi:hypothetical protein
MTITSIFESLSSSPQVTSIDIADSGVIFHFANECRLEIHECYWALRCYMRMGENGEFEPYVKLLATSHDSQSVKEYALKQIVGLPVSSFINLSFDPPLPPNTDWLKTSMGDASITFSILQGVEWPLESGDTPVLDMDLHPLRSHEAINWVFVDEGGNKITSTQVHGLERIE